MFFNKEIFDIQQKQYFIIFTVNLSSVLLNAERILFVNYKEQTKHPVFT